MEYKVGDWVTVLHNTVSNFHEGADTFKIGYIQRNPKENGFVCEEDHDIGNGIFFGGFRHAYDYEIPGYIPSSKPESYKYLTKLFKKLKIK